MRIHFALAAAGLAFPCAAAAAATGINAGSPLMKLEAGQAALRTGAFTDNFYRPGGTGGEVVANANIFTGQPSYAIPLHALNPRGQAAFPLNLVFSGPVFPTVENNNDRAPAGWIGLGWSLNVPFVAVNHKGTFTYADDVVMCNLGPYGGGQILREPTTGRYYVATAPTIRVEFDTVSHSGSPLFGQIKEWRFRMPDGTRLIFGDARADTVANSQRYLQSNKGLITASPYNTGSTRPFLYRWDIRRMEDDSRKTGIDFEHEKFQEPLWGGKSYTRESYLKTAAWKDEFGNEVQRLDLGLDTLETGEFFGYFPNASKSSQKTFETRRLKDVSVRHEGRRHSRFVLQKDVRSTDYGKKRLLGGIQAFFGETEKAAPGWEFSYRAEAPGKFLLEEIRLPSGATEKYEYRRDFVGSAGRQQAEGVFRDKNGQPVVPSGGPQDWIVEATCDDRFCYEILRGRAPHPDKVWVRVTHNTGNYFDTAAAYQETLQASGANFTDWRVVPMGNHFLVANARGGTVDLMEWGGKTFEKIDALFPASDPLRAGFGGEIEIHPAGNYFVVYRKTSVKRTWVYMKDPASGKWKNMTHGSTATFPGGTCGLHNPPIGKFTTGAPVPVRPSGDSCMVWNSDVILSANPRMLAIASGAGRVLYLYALKRDGSGFDLVSGKMQFLDTSTQVSLPGGGVSQVRWKRQIVDLQTPGDLLVIKDHVQPGGPSTSSYTRYYMMFYDGDTIRNVGRLAHERDDGNNTSNLGNKWDRHLVFGPDYFIHANTKLGGATWRRIEYWRRMQNADSIYFQLAKVLRTDLHDEDEFDLRITLNPRFVSVEYYPNGSFAQGAFPLHYPLLASGKYRSWIYRIADNGGIDSLHESLYSRSWGGGCTTRLWNKTFSNLDQTMLAMTSRGAGVTCPCTDACIADRYSARLNFHSPGVDMSYFPQASYAGADFRNQAMTLADRLAAVIKITAAGSALDSIYTKKSYYNGTDYEDPYSTTVSRFIREAVPGDAHPPRVTEFQFGGVSGVISEFNHNFLTPQFEYAKIVHKGLPGGTKYTQYVDYLGQGLQQDSAGLSGRVRCVTTVNGNGDTLAVQHSQFGTPYARGWPSPGVRDTSVHDPWPQGVAVNRVKKSVSRHWAGNRSHRTHRTFYHAYSDSLEVPLFTVTEQGNRRAVSQSILDADGARVKRSLAYDYPDTAALTDSILKGYRTTPLPISAAQGKYAIASSEVAYDPVFKYQVNQALGWRDPGGSWDDEELKAGPVPAFDPAQNTFVVSQVSRRDSLGQVLESFTEDGEDNRKYASVFYEGRAALPVGVVTGARRDNAAVLTAENGSVPQLLAAGKLDRDGIWDSAGTVYDSLQVRTGRYSFKVTDNFGPSGNLRLKDVQGGGFGFIASAWIYGDMDDEPVFSVARRHADNSPQDEVRAAPVDGPYQRGKWQRWEAHLSHGALTANGMFADESGDYLRFYIGSVDTVPGVNPSRVIYVDDVVLRPDNSVFSLTAYNGRGQPTHTTDTHHRTFIHEYGFAGQPTVTRDERGRIFGQGGFNKPGENLP